MEGDQYLRKASLILVAGEKALDLSEFHFKFQSAQQDEESPNNCAIRVWNLSEDTVKQIKGEYSEVVLQAGYENADYGVIFKGTIKQYRIGRENDQVSNYLDLLAADGDTAYNFALVNASSAAGSTAGQRIAVSVSKMKAYGVEQGKVIIPDTGGVLPRGKVLFGLARAIIRNEARNQGATWNIDNGKVNVVPLDGYLPGEAVVLTSETGLIGRPEQTEQGLRVTCLINPKIVVGGLVKIDNKSINQTLAAKGSEIPGAQLIYNRYAGIQQFANIADDGIYRVYVVEYRGDTRGHEWYCELICLAVDPVTGKVQPYG